MKSILVVLVALSACKHTTPPPLSPTLPTPHTTVVAESEPQPSFDIEVSCDEIANNPNHTFTVDRLTGETVSIRLCSRAGTGYEWLETEADSTQLTRKVWQFTSPPDSQIIGGSGWRDAVYEIKKGGDTTVKLVYRRQWVEGDTIAFVNVLIQTPEA